MSGQSFLNYPPPREGPNVPYKHEDQVIPVFRGRPLAIGATLYAASARLPDHANTAD